MKHIINFNNFEINTINEDVQYFDEFLDEGLFGNKEDRLKAKYQKAEQKAIEYLKKYKKSKEDYSDEDWKLRIAIAMTFGCPFGQKVKDKDAYIPVNCAGQNHGATNYTSKMITIDDLKNKYNAIFSA